MNPVLPLVRRSISVRRSSFILAIAAMSAAPAFAVDGTWNTQTADTAAGTYSDPANWLGGVIAEGTGATANFNTLDVVGVNLVNIREDTHILGNLVFGDTDTSTAGGWWIPQAFQLTPGDPNAVPPILPTYRGATLTLAGAAPTITTNALAAGSTARIDAVLAGTNGLTITGAGTLHLANANTYTGGTVINNGNVMLGTGTTFSLIGAAGANITLNGTNTISSGHSASGTMEVQQNLIASAGSTTTFNLGNRSRIGQTGTARTVTGTGNLIFNMAGNASRNDFTANFTTFAGNVTIGAPNQVLGTDGVTMVSPIGRMLINGGQFGQGFTASALTLDGFAVLQAITNSGGNTINIGSLSGTSATAGFIAPTAGPATLSIGALNTNTTFAGLFVGNNIVTKVGTGKLTLTNGQFHTNNTNINAGTLALSGAGALPTSPLIAMANGTTFDVSGTSSVYGTAALQTLQSASGSTVSIIGPYNHSDGTLNPGTATGAGRMNVTGDLTLGGGVLNMELSTNLTPGGTNDLLSVSGVTTLSGGLTLNVGVLGGLSTGAYTLLQSTGGITGSTAGWTFNFGARGTPPVLAVVGNSLQLTVSSTAGAPLIWKGTTDGNWNVNNTPNWLNTVSNATDKFFQLDTVRFDDSASLFNVAVVGSVTPAAVVVDNTTAYVFSGSGAIAGGGSLTKRGAGTLTISNTGVNGFGAGVTVEAGTLDIGATGQNGIGNGAITLAGGTFRTITPTGGNVTLANPIAVTGTSTLVTANSATTARQTILTGPITGSGSVSIVNDNTAVFKGLDIADTSNFTGTMTVNDNLAIRFTTATNGNPAMKLVINGNGGVGTIFGSPLVLPIGELSGNGTLRGHQSSGGGSTVEWQIGSLNTASTFSGLVVDGAQGTTVRPVMITKVGTGTLTFSGANTYTGATTVKAGTLSLGELATGPVLGSATVLAPGGADIQGGKLVLGYPVGNSSAEQVRTILAAGYAQPTKFLTGLLRSTQIGAANRTLGFVDDGTAVTIAYTVPGDANLSLSVEFQDLVALAQNYNLTGRVWSQGDFNYSTVTDFADLIILAQNYNLSAVEGDVSSLGSDFAADWALAQSLVPEPTTLLAGAGLASIVLRRRRNA
jgi:fibronectin-binding autotransporter adhesin